MFYMKSMFFSSSFFPLIFNFFFKVFVLNFSAHKYLSIKGSFVKIGFINLENLKKKCYSTYFTDRL